MLFVFIIALALLINESAQASNDVMDICLPTFKGRPSKDQIDDVYAKYQQIFADSEGLLELVNESVGLFRETMESAGSAASRAKVIDTHKTRVCAIRSMVSDLGGEIPN